jgi:hypothetical protein
VDLQSLFIGLPCLAVGLATLIFPRKRRLAAESNLAVRKAELADGASERYFEERRALDAYPLPATDGKWRVRGGLLTVSAIALLALSYFR